MAIAIKNISFKNGQDEKMKDSTNTPVVKIIGSVRRTPGDNPLLKIFLGKREEYQKNKAFKVDVDNNGNFTKVLEFQDDVGKYFITAELLCDNNEFDTVTESVFFKDLKPTIDDFTITNADSVSKKSYTNDVFYFNSYEKNSVVVTYASNPVDSDLEYFYKLWLSCDIEPDSAVPLSYGQNFTELNINLIENGDYFVYFKVIDSAGNFTTEKRKISIAKIKPDVTIAYLQIVSNDYFVTNDTNNSTKLFRLLVDIRAGIKINKAELRLYKDNKMITMKNNSDEFNKNILRQLQNSGSYFLDPIDISNWGLTYGSYEIEIYYKDVFNIEYYTNRTSIYVKDRQPKLYCNQLDQSNPATLIFDSYTELEFFFEDPFFKFKDKQIILKKLNSETLKFDSIISTKNEEWQEVETGVYKTKLKIFFSEKDVNKIDGKFRYQMFEFSLGNDYSDIGTFIVPLVYKAEKNKVVLHEDFIYPKSNEFQSKENGENIFYNDGVLLLPKESDSVFLKFKILNEVDFGDILIFHTCKNELIFSYGTKKDVFSFTDPDDFNIVLNFSTFEIDKKNGASFNLNTNEVCYDNNNPDLVNLDVSFFDSSEFKIQNTNFVCYENESFLEFIPKNVLLEHQNLSVENYNDYYQKLIFRNPYGFSNNEIKRNLKNSVSVSDKNSIFSNYNQDFDVTFNRNLTTVFKNVTIDNTFKNDKIELFLEIPYFNLDEEILFFVDSQCEFNEKTVSSVFSSFEYCNSVDNSIYSGNVIFDSFLVCEKQIFGTLIKIFIAGTYVSFVFSEPVSNFRYLNLDLNKFTKDHQFFDFLNKSYTSKNGSFVYSFKLNDGFEFYNEIEYKISFFNEFPKKQLVFENIETKKELKDGSSFFTVFYKHKNHSNVFSFDVFYELSLTKPILTYSFSESSIKTNKVNQLTLNLVSLLNVEKINSIKLKNKDFVLFQKDSINSDSFDIPINIYDGSGLKKNDVLYFENEGSFNLNLEYSLSGDTASSSLELGTFFIGKSNDNFYYFFESVFDGNTDFKNKTFEFFVYNSFFDFSIVAKRIKKMVSNVPVDCFDNTYFSKQFKNVSKSSELLFSEVFVDDFVDGVYNLDLLIVDKKTNQRFEFSKKICINSLKPFIEFSNQTFVNDFFSVDVVLKNVFTEENFSQISAVLYNFENNAQQNFFEVNSSFETPLLYNQNKIKFFAHSSNKGVFFEFPDVFEKTKLEAIPFSYLSNFYCFVDNKKIFDFSANFSLFFKPDSFFIFNFYCSDDTEFEWYKNGSKESSSFVIRYNENFSVPITTDLREFSFIASNSSGSKTFGPFTFDFVEDFSGFETVLCLENNNDELFKKSIFLESRITSVLENNLVFEKYKVSSVFDSFSNIVFDETLSPQQISFICFSGYNFLKMFDQKTFRSKIHENEVLKVITTELIRWCRNNNFSIPSCYNKDNFDFCFNGFVLANNIEILKKVVSV